MVRIDPPIDSWARSLSARATVATGHQALLWHPGILAKIIAMKVAADRFGCGMLHIVVDQDVHEATTIELPRLDGERISIEAVTLAQQDATVPTGFQPSATWDTHALHHTTLRDALKHGEGDTLAKQITDAVMRMIEPIVGEVPVLYVSEMPGGQRYQALLDAMQTDAINCAAAYNRALDETAVHQVAKLQVSDERTELPLWACQWMQPRQRVYVADGRWVFASGEAIDTTQYKLLPKALTLSAVMRTIYSDLFIHGLGGAQYDRATEAWWQNWRNEKLNAMAMATADVYLPFDVPVATRKDYDHAVWWQHHLKHNLDAKLKAPLLDRMAAAQDPATRATIFAEIHSLNHTLRDRHADRLEAANHAKQRARIGVANAAAAHKRDWCVGLYNESQLRELFDQVADRDTMRT